MTTTIKESVLSHLSPSIPADSRNRLAEAAERFFSGRGVIQESEDGERFEEYSSFAESLNIGKSAAAKSAVGGASTATTLPLAAKVANWQRPPVEGHDNSRGIPLTEGLKSLMLTGRVKPATPAAKMHANVMAWGVRPEPVKLA